MRALIQRVSRAHVSVENRMIAEINSGLVVFLGVEHEDDVEMTQKLWTKIFNLRIFADTNGKTNLSLADVKGDVCIVSQFTLSASCKKGNRPSFSGAANPALAEMLYEQMIEYAGRDVTQGYGGIVGKGEFGAMMQVALVNDGPFTLWLDSKEL